MKLQTYVLWSCSRPSPAPVGGCCSSFAPHQLCDCEQALHIPEPRTFLTQKSNLEKTIYKFPFQFSQHLTLTSIVFWWLMYLSKRVAPHPEQKALPVFWNKVSVLSSVIVSPFSHFCLILLLKCFFFSLKQQNLTYSVDSKVELKVSLDVQLSTPLPPQCRTNVPSLCS